MEKTKSKVIISVLAAVITIFILAYFITTIVFMVGDNETLKVIGTWMLGIPLGGVIIILLGGIIYMMSYVMIEERLEKKRLRKDKLNREG